MIEMQSLVLRVDDTSQVGAARRGAVSIAERLGADSVEAGHVGLVATELATNLLRHADGGELLAQAMTGPSGPGLEILALDRGPGIPDVERALRDGFSTAGSAGTGLGAVRRIAGRCDIYSAPGAGTAVLARLRFGAGSGQSSWTDASAARTIRAEVSGVAVPMAGEVRCGDAWTWAGGEECWTILAVDGLGHGDYAATAAAEALRVFQNQSGSPLIDLVAAIPHLFARIVTDEVLAAMADTVTPQGIVAVCYLPQTALAEILDGAPKLVAVLCRIQDPGNAGTILRAADAAGADALILTSGSVDIYNPKAVRSTVGSLFHLPIVTGVDFDEAVESLRAAGQSVLAADGYGDRNLDDLQDASTRRRLGESADPDSGATIRLEDPTAWLFGNEAAGLTEEELAAADERVAVSLFGVAEWLNVGTAATVCMYASARAQRGNKDK